MFAGRRGRLLAGLLIAEFAAAVQVVAYATVLPTAAQDLGGQQLYGATVAGGSLVTVLVLALGPALVGRFPPRRALVLATGLYAVGILAAALAPAMGWVLVGGLLRGAASGLLLGVGLTAIGGLYDDVQRPRVLGLFAIMWLLPSFAGPSLTAVVAAAAGWRWAMAWPILLVLAARVLVVRAAGLIPWERSTERLAPGPGLAVVAGLVAASAASGIGGPVGGAVFVAGLAVAVLGGRAVLAALAPDRARRLVVVAFAVLCLAFFGAQTLLPLLVVEGFGRGVVASGVALGAGLVAWSLTGLRVPRSDRPGELGLWLLAAALLTMAAAAVLGGFGLAVAAFAVAGTAMGLAYPQLTSRALAAGDLPAAKVSGAATAVGFAEVCGTAVGALLGGGLYSLGVASPVAPEWTIGSALVLLAVAAAATARVLAVRAASARAGTAPVGPTSSPAR